MIHLQGYIEMPLLCSLAGTTHMTHINGICSTNKSSLSVKDRNKSLIIINHAHGFMIYDELHNLLPANITLQ